MKRVVVTGATGFIGRACLAPLVARGYDVHAIVHSRPATELAGVTWHPADLLGPDAPTLVTTLAPSHLLHLAWYAVPGRYWTARDNLAWVRASLALHEAFVSAGGTRLVIAGTSAEYDWSHGRCHETATPLAATTYYAVCKRALADLIAADAAATGISAAWARFFFLFGPHEYPERLVASVIRALLRGERARCSAGTQARDFLHVADAGAATVALLDSDVRGPVNIGSGDAITVRALVARIAALVGGAGQVEHGTTPITEPPLVVADVARLRDEVGFTPASGLDQRLGETIAWWREHQS